MLGVSVMASLEGLHPGTAVGHVEENVPVGGVEGLSRNSRVPGIYKNLPRGITCQLLRRDFLVRTVLADGPSEELCINEGEDIDTLPRIFLAVHVYLEGFGVEVQDGRGGCHHEVAVGGGEDVGGGRGETAHKLFKGPEGRALVKFDGGHLSGEVGQVAQHRTVMIGKEPFPADTSFIIICQTPDQSFQIRLLQFLVFLRVHRSQLQLLKIIASLKILLSPADPTRTPPHLGRRGPRLFLQRQLCKHRTICPVPVTLLRLQLRVRGSWRLPVPLVPAPPFDQIFGVIFSTFFENSRLRLAHFREKAFQPGRVQDASAAGQILTLAPRRALSSVDVKEEVEGAFPNIQCGKVGQKVVADEKGQKNEVVEDGLQIVRSIVQTVRELHLQIFPEDTEVQYLKVALLNKFQHRLPRFLLVVVEAHAEVDNLAQKRKVWLVAGQPQHDQISVLAVHTVPCVGAVARRRPHLPNVLHDLMLPLPRHLLPAENHLQIPPRRILLQLLLDVILDGGAHPPHKFCPGGDTVRVEGVPQDVPLWLASTCLPPLLSQGLLQVAGRAKPAASLLVHLGAGGYAVHSHVNAHLGLHDLGHDTVDVVHDAHHHGALGETVADVRGRRVRAAVDYAVHVKIKMVEFGKEGVGCQHLIDFRVPFRQPSIKLQIEGGV
mmetsp:Transcript_32284/g.74352  ORF Transcript_32284/g.74352 Transcript_32284/m.74352 type:complete len:661 (+) Transcript_32284:2630-4612(+)